MEDENPNHHHFGRLEINGGVDSVSSLPDEILHQILSYIPTIFAIRTSFLSKRWRHVWCKTPCLYFDFRNPSENESISKTLASYSAARITSFCLRTTGASKRDRYVSALIKFAMSHKVDKLTLDLFCNEIRVDRGFPDYFFNNSSLKQLIVGQGYRNNSMKPRCTVSWTSLRDLFLSFCELSDASFSKILSGCPMLESLTLKCPLSLEYLDLSKSIVLRRLDIELILRMDQKTMQIVAPHIYSLRLRNLGLLEHGGIQINCNLVDVSSLTEANIEFSQRLPKDWCYATNPLKDALLQTIVQPMLEKLQNVENLTLGVSFLQMLSIAEFRGVPFPTFKVKTLTLETRILRSVVLVLAKLLQNSPGLKKDKFVNGYLNSEKWWRLLKDVVSPTSWECEVAEPKLVASFVELLLANTKTIEIMVLRLGSYIDRSRFGELSQITDNLFRDNKVSIVLE